MRYQTFTGATGPQGATGAFTGTFTEAHITTDITTSGTDPTFTDLCTATVTGSVFLIQASYAGIANGNMTPRIRVLIDGVETNYLGAYGSDSLSGSGVQASIQAMVTLSSASHAFKLQASSGSSTITFHAATNPTREYASIIVTKVS